MIGSRLVNTSMLFLTGLGLAFAVAIAPAEAHHCKGGHANDPECDGGGGGGGGGGSEVLFEVFVQFHNGNTYNSPTYVPVIPAETREQKGPGANYTAWYPRHDLDATVTTSTGAMLTDDISIVVKTDEFGDIISIQLFGQDTIGKEGIMHETDELFLANPVTPTDLGFTLHVHEDDIEVWKLDTHVKKNNSQRVESVGFISLDDMEYDPSP